MTKLPAYLVAAAEEFQKALESSPFVDATLSVRIQNGKAVHVEIGTVIKHKPAELAGHAGARYDSGR
jgi:hypothetical protein